MINGIRLKVCGITSPQDAEAAANAGADYLGFVFYPKSPRHAPLAQYQAMKDRLPATAKVAVCVEPTKADLAGICALDFKFIQVHCNPDTLTETVALWTKMVGIGRLWLAPGLAPEADIFPELLPYAEHFLLDVFHGGQAGAKGRTHDWEKFKRHRATYPDKQWMLTGGLDPLNIAEAVRATGANLVDVNSGVEQKPGVKSPAKLKAFVLALHQATKPGKPS